jgi:hypothetical protein
MLRQSAGSAEDAALKGRRYNCRHRRNFGKRISRPGMLKRAPATVGGRYSCLGAIAYIGLLVVGLKW